MMKKRTFHINLNMWIVPLNMKGALAKFEAESPNRIKKTFLYLIGNYLSTTNKQTEKTTLDIMREDICDRINCFINLD